MHQNILSSLRRRCVGGVAFSVLSLFATLGFAQTAESTSVNASSGNANDIVLESGSVTEFGGGQSIDGNVIGANNAKIIITPGLQTINGDLTLSGSKIVVRSNQNKEVGQVNVSGTLTLDPNNPPVLSIDLSEAYFSRGEQFVIFTAATEVGHFAGMQDDGLVQAGGYSLRVSYDVGSGAISVMVVTANRPWDPEVTPIMDISPDLIDPTSTSPGGF